MQWLHSIPLVMVTASSACMGVFWGLGLLRIVRTSRALPTARDGIALSEQQRDHTPSVCVIIPAHNQQDHIASLITSLARQDYPAMRVVLALDRCTDGTAERAGAAIAGDQRFEVIEIDACPDDWAGKVHAVWRAVQHSDGDAEYLLFLDADTTLHPRCIRATVALATRRRLDLLSLLSTLTNDRWFERLVQPAAGLELIYQFPMLRANAIGSERPFANGQFMLFRRDAYQRIGGHESVKGELLEDLALAGRIASAKLSCGVLLADGMIVCGMYDSWSRFRHGWKRIYAEAARCRVRRLNRWAMRQRIVATVLPIAAAAHVPIAIFVGWGGLAPVWLAAAGASVSLAALAIWLGVIVAVYRLSGVPVIYAPGYVVGGWLVASILSEAARDLAHGTPTTWAGRTYARTSR